MTPGFENGTMLGHEFAGVVVDGRRRESRRSSSGQRVVNTSMVADGTCPACRAGRPTQCTAVRSSATRASTRGSTAGRPSSSACRTPTACSRRCRTECRTRRPSSSPTTSRPPTTRSSTRRRRARATSSVVVGLGAVGLMAVHVRGRRRRAGARGRRRVAAARDRRGGSAREAVDAGARLPRRSPHATDGLGGRRRRRGGRDRRAALDAALRLARGRGVVSVVGAHFEPDFPLDNALMFERELTLRFSIGDADRPRRAAARADRGRAARPGDASSRTACRSPTRPRPTACSTRARRRRWCCAVRYSRAAPASRRSCSPAAAAARRRYERRDAAGGEAADGRLPRREAPDATAGSRACTVGRSFNGAAIVRCNVNFGDPHIEAYCIVLRRGEALQRPPGPGDPVPARQPRTAGDDRHLLMRVENAFDVPASVDEAWRLLNDVPEIVPCMPGAELVEVVGDDAWKAKLHVKLGPIALQFLADVDSRGGGRGGRSRGARRQGARGEGARAAPRRRSSRRSPPAERRNARRHRHRARAPRRGRPVRPRRRRRRRLAADGAVRRVHRGEAGDGASRAPAGSRGADRRPAARARRPLAIPVPTTRR